MPIIRIESLPQEPALSIPMTCKNISRRFSELSDINEEYISVVWKTIFPEHYSEGGITVENQPNNSHPALVSLLVPSIHSKENHNNLINALAQAILDNTQLRLDNIFIHLQIAESGTVFDNGEIQHWG